MYSCTSLERYGRTYGTQYDIRYNTYTYSVPYNGKAHAIAHLLFRNKKSKNSKDHEF